MVTIESKFQSREGHTLRAAIRFSKDGRRKPVILFLHGLNGFKDWGAFPYCMKRLAEEGFVTVAMSFSGCGVADDTDRFTELAAYSENTISREIEETIDMLCYIVRGNLGIDKNEYDPDSIGLMGHSMGAGVALITAAEYSFVRCLALWSPVASFDRFTERQKQEWRERGYFERENSRTHQRLRMNRTLLDDIELHTLRRSISTAAHRIARQAKQTLIVVGSEDLTTPLKEAESIHRSIPSSDLIIIERTGHTIGAEHPFAGTNDCLEKAIAVTIDFFRRHLLPS